MAEWLSDAPYPLALVEQAPTGSGDGEPAVVRALAVVRRARALLCEAGRGAAIPADLRLDPDPERACWQLCALAPLTPLDQQRLLETNGTAARLAELTALCEALGDDLSMLLAGGL